VNYVVPIDSALQAAALWFAAGTLVLLLTGRAAVVGRIARVLMTLAVGAVLAGFARLIGLDPAAEVEVGLLVLIFCVAGPTRWRAGGAVFWGCLIASTSVYLIYLVRATYLLGATPASVLLGGVLLALELGATVLILASAFEMVDALCSPPSLPPLPPPPDRWPVVCLQVATYNEPAELVIETIRSLVAIDYPALRIQLIDNNTTDETRWRPLEAECARLRMAGHRVEFVHLADWPGFKSGALNWGRVHLDPDVEIVGVVDADFIVDPAFLKATAPYFSDPMVAFVQTPQDYRGWEESSYYRACYVGFAYFFKVGMVSRAHRNAIIFAGTMGLIRRSVLDEIGGWDEVIITEDADASLRMLALGYSSVFVPTAFGKGIMPLTYEGLRKQRFRWAFGGIQILRRHWRDVLPWSRGTRLTFGQRYDYLIGSLWWFNDALTFGFTLFIFATALGLVVGRPFVVQRLSAIGMVIPLAFVLLNLLRYFWATRAVSGSGAVLALGALRVNLSLSWVILLACFRGLTQEHGVFLRTSKFKGRPAVGELRMVFVETILAVTGVVLAVAVLAVAGYTLLGLVLAALLCWSVLIYGSATGYALGDPARTPISEVLIEKARLEIGLGVGHAFEVRPIRISIAVAVLGLALLLGAGVVAESGQPAVPGAGPLLGEPAQGPLKAGNAPIQKAPAAKQVPPGRAKKS
jgi:cellulose synthase/poly-beta-1,6-N-acetylglucosamine synthase-like glycosyltransferase